MKAKYELHKTYTCKEISNSLMVIVDTHTSKNKLERDLAITKTFLGDDDLIKIEAKIIFEVDDDKN